MPKLPGPCCFAGGLRCLKPTPHGFSFVGKQDSAREAFCAQAPAMPPEPARPLSAEVPSQRRPKTSFLELHSAKGNSPRAANHSPNAPPLRKAALAGFAPRPVLALRPRRVWAASRSLCTGAWPRITGAGNQLQTCSPSGRRRMGSEKALCALAPAPHPPPGREGPT